MKNFLSIVFIFIFSMTARADLYDIQGIPIEAELTSAKEARAAAIMNGQVDAFWSLMQKMISADDLSRVPFLETASVANLVQNISLTNEKTTATRYRATMGVRFYPDKIQSFLTENQIPFLQRSLPPTLVIPVFQKDDETLLLTDNNPLYAYFKENPLFSEDETPLPIGDLEEIALTGTAWDNQDYHAFLSLAEKYNIRRVMLFILRQQGPYTTVTTQTFSKDNPEPTVSVFEFTDPLGDLKSLMPIISKSVWDKQQADWRAENTNDLQAPLNYWIRVPITRLTTWHAIRQKLEKATYLNHFDIRAFRKNEVFLLIRYKGTSDMLNAQFKKSGLALSLSDIDGLWDLTFNTQETP